MTKIEKYGIGPHILDLYGSGLNPSQIAKTVQDEGYNIDDMTVRRFLERQKKECENTSNLFEKYKFQLIDHTFKAAEQFLAANQQTLIILQKAIQNGELSTALRAIERIEKQIQLHKEQFPTNVGELDFTLYYESFPPELRGEVKALVEKHLGATS